MAARGSSAALVLPWLGLAGLTGFLIALGGVFLAEDEARRGESDGQRAALEAFATASVRRSLEDDWRLGVALMDDALKDPLLDDSRLLLVSDGAVLLPRRAAGTLEGVAQRVRVLVEGPPPARPTEEDPTSERDAFVAQLQRALTLGDRPGVEAAVRGLLAHRRQFVLGPVDDLASQLAVVELLQTRSTPSRLLLERMLREGFGVDAPGLQRQVLALAPRLSAAELTGVCEVVERQCRRAQVPVDDFVRRCAVVAEGPLRPPSAPGEGLALSGGWLVRGGDEVRGVAVVADDSLSAQESLLLERGLLARGDRLRLSVPEGRLEALEVEVDSPRWARAAKDRGQALRWKLGLSSLAFLLGVGVVVSLRALQRKERAVVEAKSLLVSTVSHELRTPLASLRVMAETLERKLAGVTAAKDWPGRIVAEVDGLSALVENILSYNRLEQGRAVLQREPWPVEGLEAVLRREAGPAMEVSVTGAEGVVVRGDGPWLELAFLNLLRNARKYSERTPVTFQVRVSTVGPRVVFEVEDNGVGIPEAEWERVFEAFHRLRDGRGRGGGGSGLGLALVRRVFQEHGGSARVERSSPEGTVFRLELPAPAPA